MRSIEQGVFLSRERTFEFRQQQLRRLVRFPNVSTDRFRPTVSTRLNDQNYSGVESGTLGVTRGYVADKTTPAQRTYLLAYTHMRAMHYKTITASAAAAAMRSTRRVMPVVAHVVCL